MTLLRVQMPHHRVPAVLLTLAVALLVPVAVSAQTTGLFVDSQPGDLVGGGQQNTYLTPDAIVSVSRSLENTISVTVQNSTLQYRWNLDFAAAAQVPLAVGSYGDAFRYPFNNFNGLNVDGNARGCNTLTGRFVVLEVAYAQDGSVTTFAADFEQHCEDAIPALFGSVRFNSSVGLAPDVMPFGGNYPIYQLTITAAEHGTVTDGASNINCGDGATLCQMTLPSTLTDDKHVTLTAAPDSGYVLRGWTGDCSGSTQMTVNVNGPKSCAPVFEAVDALSPRTELMLDSSPGDGYANGDDRLFFDSNSLWSVTPRGTTNGVAVQVLGNDNSRWIIDVDAPDGTPLTVGDYWSARDASANVMLPGLFVENLSSETTRSCTGEGRFTVYELEYSAGAVSRFSGDLEVHCGTNSPAVFIAIRYNSTRGYVPFDGAYPVYTLTIAPPSLGKVTGGGLDCGDGSSTCEITFTSPTAVTVTATPDSGALFTGWIGDCAGVRTVTLTVDGAKRCAASFEPSQPSVARSILFLDSTAGDLIGNGEQHLFTMENTRWQVTNASNGVRFSLVGDDSVRWSVTLGGLGGAPLTPGTYYHAVGYTSGPLTPTLAVATSTACTSTGRFTVYDVAYAGDGSLTYLDADFEQHCYDGTPALFGALRYNSTFAGFTPFNGGYPSYSIDIITPTHGSIVADGIDCGGSATTCTATYPSAQTVQVHAIPNDGYLFSGWTTDCAGGMTTSLDVNGVKRCGARFDTPATTIPRTLLTFDARSTDPTQQPLESVLSDATGSWTVFSNGGTNDATVLVRDVDGRDWEFAFDTPPGSTLQPGTYTNVTQWQFNGTGPMASDNVPSASCLVAGGQFTVHEIAATQSAIQRLAVDFVFQCRYSSETHRGSIRYNSTIALPSSAIDVALSADRTSPQTPGTTINFTASPFGGVAPYEFKWYMFNGTSWTVAQDWSTSATFAWTPVSRNAAYRVGVWARAGGSIADAPDATDSVPFPIDEPRVTSVSVTSDLAAPQPPGTTVTFTASPTGGVGPYQYKWYLFDGASWTVLRDWSTSAACAWTASSASASYRLGVWVRSAGVTADAAEASASTPFPIEPLVIGSVSLGTDLNAPQPPGTTITWTARVSGGVAPQQYKWWVFDGTAWTIARNWSTSATFAWTPTLDMPGARVGVWARSAGSTTDAPEATQSAPFAIVTPRVTAVGVTSNVAAPQPPGTTITFTASATGGTAPQQFKWWVFDGATWTVAMDWSTSATFAWTPPAGLSGARVGVWARSAGSSADAAEAAVSIPFAIVQPTVSAVALTSDLNAPQSPATTITFTATPSGGVAPYEYRWWVFDGTSWTGGSWTTSNTFAWTPSSAGNYRVGVWVRSSGSATDAPESSQSIGFVIQ